MKEGNDEIGPAPHRPVSAPHPAIRITRSLGGVLPGIVAAVTVALAGFPAVGAAPARPDGYQDPAAGYHYRFPQDHGSHDAFKTEWWYYTGHVTARNGRRFGYQVTFFRQGVDRSPASGPASRWAIRDLYLAHVALSDLDRGRFSYAEKLSRAGLGKAGADPGRLHAWIDRWTAEAAESDPHRHRLTAASQDFALDLVVTSHKPPVLHGREGISRKGPGAGQASHYYSLTRLDTRGSLVVDGERLEVRGLSWMDHEFGSGELGPDQVGWDWFSVQLGDNVELMVYRLRRADGTIDPASSGTLVLPDGRSQPLARDEIGITVLDSWTSPRSGARYPHRWRITVPSAGLDLEVRPELADQELRTSRSTQVTYWEGASRVTGTSRGLPATGVAYVELTGYAEPFKRRS